MILNLFVIRDIRIYAGGNLSGVIRFQRRENLGCQVLHDSFRNLFLAVGFCVSRIYCQHCTLDDSFFHTLPYDLGENLIQGYILEALCSELCQ